MGPIEQMLLRQAKIAGDPVPSRIANKPRLGLGLEFFLDAFYDLENDRQWLVADAAIPLPISWSIIDAYTRAHDLTGALRDDLLYFIRELDAAYTKHISKGNK